ncbi:MAG: glycoside hydrolase family 127 protein [Oscillospiraceae bacterium]
MKNESSCLQSKLDSDLEKIYLGNLGTVDCDLCFPTEGENGSHFSWTSSAEYLVAKDGKVTRPQYGAGNRTVALTVTAELEGCIKTREFSANILEKEYNATVIYGYDINLVTAVGKCPKLPAVAIIKNDRQEDAVVSVKWDIPKETDYSKEGTFTVKGSVKDGVFVAAQVTVTDDEEILCPHLDKTKRATAFGLEETTLEKGSDFYKAMERNLQFMLSVNDDSMLYNFRVAAGLDTKNAVPMTGWEAPECNVKGHTTGHYLSGLALCYGATGDKKIKEKLDYMVSQLLECRQGMAKRGDCKPGFLSAYSEEQFDLLEKYTTYPTIWAPYYTLHKIMAGLRDCYLYGHNHQALEMYRALGEWVYNRLSPLSETQRSRMWSMYIAGEYGGMNEVMADLYEITGEERFLIASRYFDNEKLYLPMLQNIDALGNLHANQHIPQIIGALRQFSVTGEKSYYTIAENFWNMVTGAHIYSIGGTGETEMFKAAGAIGEYITEQTAESCASYNMLKLTGALFAYNPRVEYMDYYEKTMYNHILSCGDITEANGGSTYFMPTSPGAKKSFNLVENTCCHGTGMENHFKYQENIYFHNEDEIYVNLYLNSELNWQKKSTRVSMSVEEGADNITAKLRVNTKENIKIKLRKPYWAQGFRVVVQGETIEYLPENGYITIAVLGENTDIWVSFLCNPWLCRTPDKPQIASICYGPYVLAALSESKEYLKFEVDDRTIAQKLRRESAGEYYIGKTKFVPFCHVDCHQSYHLYVKVK